MLGAPQAVYNGGLLRATVRYYDADRRRPGLPQDVAALVDEIKADKVGVQLVNLSRTETRWLIVQAGAFGEHSFTDVKFQDETAEGKRGSNVSSSDRSVSVNGKYFTVELPPNASIRVEAGMKRFANQPSYAFPWHGGKVPNPFAGDPEKSIPYDKR